MSAPEHPWWDRDIDEKTGTPIRNDVREAAHAVWQRVYALSRRVLGDDMEASVLLESAVTTVSRYLDRINVPPHSSDPGGLLVLNVYRAARRLAKRKRRIEPIGGINELANLLRAPDWSDEVDHRLFLERLGRELQDANQAILRLRLSGYEWPEIAKMMQTTAMAIRNSFWRDVRRAYLKLQTSLSKTPPRGSDEGK